MKDRDKPCYCLASVRELVSSGRYRLRRRAQCFIFNRYASSDEVVKCIFEGMSEGDFRKTIELVNYPGMKADVYMAHYDDMIWFVKYCIQDDGGPWVDIWSCNWDSVIH